MENLASCSTSSIFPPKIKPFEIYQFKLHYLYSLIYTGKICHEEFKNNFMDLCMCLFTIDNDFVSFYERELEHTASPLTGMNESTKALLNNININKIEISQLQVLVSQTMNAIETLLLYRIEKFQEIFKDVVEFEKLQRAANFIQRIFLFKEETVTNYNQSETNVHNYKIFPTFISNLNKLISWILEMNEEIDKIELSRTFYRDELIMRLINTEMDVVMNPSNPKEGKFSDRTEGDLEAMVQHSLTVHKSSVTSRCDLVPSVEVDGKSVPFILIKVKTYPMLTNKTAISYLLSDEVNRENNPVYKDFVELLLQVLGYSFLSQERSCIVTDSVSFAFIDFHPEEFELICDTETLTANIYLDILSYESPFKSDCFNKSAPSYPEYITLNKLIVYKMLQKFSFLEFFKDSNSSNVSEKLKYFKDNYKSKVLENRTIEQNCWISQFKTLVRGFTSKEAKSKLSELLRTNEFKDITNNLHHTIVSILTSISEITKESKTDCKIEVIQKIKPRKKHSRDGELIMTYEEKHSYLLLDNLLCQKVNELQDDDSLSSLLKDPIEAKIDLNLKICGSCYDYLESKKLKRCSDCSEDDCFIGQKLLSIVQCDIHYHSIVLKLKISKFKEIIFENMEINKSLKHILEGSVDRLNKSNINDEDYVILKIYDPSNHSCHGCPPYEDEFSTNCVNYSLWYLQEIACYEFLNKATQDRVDVEVPSLFLYGVYFKLSFFTDTLIDDFKTKWYLNFYGIGLVMTYYEHSIDDEDLRNNLAEIFKDGESQLKTIHELGIAHGDIKKDNLMISKSNRIVFIDYGAGKLIGNTGPIKDGQFNRDLYSYSKVKEELLQKYSNI